MEEISLFDDGHDIELHWQFFSSGVLRWSPDTEVDHFYGSV
jgi:hypothetical protein